MLAHSSSNSTNQISEMPPAVLSEAVLLERRCLKLSGLLCTDELLLVQCAVPLGSENASRLAAGKHGASCNANATLVISGPVLRQPEPRYACDAGAYLHKPYEIDF
jgi:hypothetical protein